MHAWKSRIRVFARRHGEKEAGSRPPQGPTSGVAGSPLPHSLCTGPLASTRKAIDVLSLPRRVLVPGGVFKQRKYFEHNARIRQRCVCARWSFDLNLHAHTLFYAPSRSNSDIWCPRVKRVAGTGGGPWTRQTRRAQRLNVRVIRVYVLVLGVCTSPTKYLRCMLTITELSSGAL